MMDKKLIKQVFTYEKVALASGATVDASAVTVDMNTNKVVEVLNANVSIADNHFTFSAYENGDKLRYTLRNVPDDVKGMEVAKEFVAFVENDITA